MTKRYLAIDYGTVRVGLAISDPLGIIATGYKTLNNRGKEMSEIIQEIDLIIKDKGISKIILGLPKRTDGKAGEKEEQVQLFGKLLYEQTGMEPILMDERYTTVIANQYMNKLGTKSRNKKEIVDQVAAEILLQDYLDRNR
ncbi:MAG: Holliday junction resolvase RuvX [Clostridiaceae bacterium]|nr:Holliday junction resolvase RuvX [Clostridiaceae bacterium]